MSNDMNKEQLHELMVDALYCTLEKCNDFDRIATSSGKTIAVITLRDETRYASASIDSAGRMSLAWMTKKGCEIVDIGYKDYGGYVDAHHIAHVLLNKWRAL